MTASRVLVSIPLVSFIALPSDAQRVTPIGPRPLAMPSLGRVERPGPPLVTRGTPSDTIVVARREVNRTNAILGGVAGGLAGAFVGLAIGAGSAQGCRGEYCGLLPAALGLAIGESLGVGLGTHLGSGSTRHENVLVSTLTSAGIFVAGALIGAGMREGGAIMVPLTPAMQIAAAWAIESGAR